MVQQELIIYVQPKTIVGQHAEFVFPRNIQPDLARPDDRERIAIAAVDRAASTPIEIDLAVDAIHDRNTKLAAAVVIPTQTDPFLQTVFCAEELRT